jgi:hypothetical protein
MWRVALLETSLLFSFYRRTGDLDREVAASGFTKSMSSTFDEVSFRLVSNLV